MDAASVPLLQDKPPKDNKTKKPFFRRICPCCGFCPCKCCKDPEAGVSDPAKNKAGFGVPPNAAPPESDGRIRYANGVWRQPDGVSHVCPDGSVVDPQFVVKNAAGVVIPEVNGEFELGDRYGCATGASDMEGRPGNPNLAFETWFFGLS